VAGANRGPVLYHPASPRGEAPPLPDLPPWTPESNK
jgi:hypothetical protein